ncbi:MAG: hypothetical protein GY884_20975 [Proteobacteria bacterium]|nr:hypothetical protein [Pseudomonadota bacterium]
MSLRDEHLDDTRVVRSGEFKLDRRRAMEKLARFQLQDPHRYVLELVAAAVRAGATAVAIENDADDFAITWDGRHPTADEIEALFDHIFSQKADDDARMLQHLAQGIHGALGLAPKWVHLVRPGLHLDLSDPLEVVHTRHGRIEGVRIHVRERFSMAVVREWVTPTIERRMLQAEAAWCPIPIEINGARLRRHLTGPPPGFRSETVGGGHVWLAEQGPIQVVRDGIRVDTIELTAGGLALRGAVHADDLKLNASRSKVVRDNAWQKLVRQLRARFRDLVRAALLDEDSPWYAADLRVTAMELITQRTSQTRSLQSMPLFFDANERLWSADQLRSVGKVMTFTAPGRMAPELDGPQLFLQNAPTPRMATILAWLEAIHVETIPRDGLFEDLFQGRLRRAELSRRRHAFDHTRALLERRFDRDGVRGSIGFGASVLPSGEYGCRVELRVDGLPVEVTQLRLPGPLSIRIEGPLDAGPRFRRIVRNPAYEGALEVASDEAGELLMELARSFDHAPVARQALHIWLKTVAVKGQLHQLDDALRTAAIFPLHGSGHVDLATLQTWLSEDGELQVCRPGLILPFGVERLLADTSPTRESLRHLFGHKSLRDVASDLEDRVVRERRLASGAEPARIPEYTVARTTIRAEGVHGEVGLLVEGGLPDGTQVRVLHHGVFLGEVLAETGFPSTRAVLDFEHIAATSRLDGLEDPEGTGQRAVHELRPALKELVLAHARSPDPDAVVQAWLEGALKSWSPLPIALQELPLFPTVTGRLESIASLAAQPAGPVEYLPKLPEGDVPPDMRGALVLDASRRRIVAAQGFGPRGKRSLRDITRRLEIRGEALRRFQSRAIEALFPIDDVVAVRHLTDGDLRVSVGLSVARDREPGLRVRFLVDGRCVTVETLPLPIAADAVVHGDRIIPDALYQNLVGETTAMNATVVDLALQAIDTWLDFPALPALARLRLLDHLLRRPSRTPEQDAACARLRAFPLLPSIDGHLLKVKDLGEVVLIPPGSPPRDAPDGRDWVRSSRDVRRLLDVAGVETVEGRALLAEIEEGEHRRSALSKEGLFPAGGAFSAAWRVDHDGAKHWIGLAVSTSSHVGRIEWLVEDRLLGIESLKVGVPVVVRVFDPALEPDLAFSAPQPGAALEDARARAREIAQAFLHACARFAHGSEPVEDGQFTRLLGERLLPTLVTYAASNDVSAWNDLPLVETSDGERVPLTALAEAAKQGRIRVVQPGTYGRPADPDRPVFRADPALGRALRAFGPTTDYAVELRREEEAHRRREAPPVRVEPQALPGVLLTIPLEGAREGFLQVDVSGRTDIVIHVDWRRLGRIPHKGPVPLVGHVSDPAIEPDATWAGPKKGKALDQLERFLEERSVVAVQRLLDEVPASRTRLWLGVLQRAFKHRRDMPKPGTNSWKRRLAGLELFRTGSGKPMTAHAVVQLRHPPRWVTPSSATPSLDPNRPFVVVEPRVMELAIAFFGGSNAKTEALEDWRVNRRRAQQQHRFELPDGRYWIQRGVEGKSFRALLALETDLDAPGRLHFRVDGVPLETREVPFPGLFGVIEVEGHDKAFTRAAKDRAREKAIDKAYEELVEAGAAGIRESWFGRRRVVEILGSSDARVKDAWYLAPLLTAPGGPQPLRSADDASVVLLGNEPVEGHFVVHDEGNNRELLAAIGLTGVATTQWRAQKAVDADRKTAAEQRLAEERALDAARKGVRSTFTQLVKGLNVPNRLGKDLELESAPMALRGPAIEGDARAIVRVAWWLGERALMTSGRTKVLPELALRVGERMASLEPA